MYLRRYNTVWKIYRFSKYIYYKSQQQCDAIHCQSHTKGQIICFIEKELYYIWISRLLRNFIDFSEILKSGGTGETTRHIFYPNMPWTREIPIPDKRLAPHDTDTVEV